MSPASSSRGDFQARCFDPRDRSAGIRSDSAYPPDTDVRVSPVRSRNRRRPRRARRSGSDCRRVARCAACDRAERPRAREHPPASDAAPGSGRDAAPRATGSQPRRDPFGPHIRHRARARRRHAPTRWPPPRSCTVASRPARRCAPPPRSGDTTGVLLPGSPRELRECAPLGFSGRSLARPEQSCGGAPDSDPAGEALRGAPGCRIPCGG